MLRSVKHQELEGVITFSDKYKFLYQQQESNANKSRYNVSCPPELSVDLPLGFNHIVSL